MILETSRLILRKMTRNDEESLLKVFSDPKTMQFYPHPFNRQMTQAWIERNMQRYSQDGFGLWAIVLKERGECIGDCGLVVQRIDSIQEVEIGYHVRRDLWGKGFATEAAQGCIEYGFNHLGFKKLISLIHPANSASCRVAEKNGMKFAKQMVWKKRPVCVYVVERGTGGQTDGT
jgi:RimJ/RimL family protein N-acetyltransferase